MAKAEELIARFERTRAEGFKTLWYMAIADTVLEALSNGETITFDGLRKRLGAKFNEAGGDPAALIYGEAMAQLDLAAWNKVKPKG